MPAPGSRRPLTVEDMWAMKRVGAPVAPADGSFAIVPVTLFDMETNESTSRLWRVDGPGADPRPLTAEGNKASSPALSPDGRRVAFVRPDAKKKGQLAILPLDGGEAETVTDLPLGISSPKWFPDGRRVAFLAEVLAEAPAVEETRKRLEEKEKDKVKAHVTENVLFRYWDHWLTEGKVWHLFVVDVETRELRDLIPDFRQFFDLDDPDGTFDISPDGREIAFTADRSDPPHRVFRYDVFTVDVEGGAVRNLTDDETAQQFRPRYSPDGRCLVYGLQTIPDFYADRVRLVRHDRHDDLVTVLTEAWDRSAGAWEFVPGSDRLLLLNEDEGRIEIRETGLEPGEPRVLRRGGHYGGLVPLADGGAFVLRDDFSHPAELFRLEAGGNAETAWTRLNTELLEGIDFGEVVDRRVEGADGRPIQVWEVRPPGFSPDRRWPGLLVVHGGPHGIWADSFHYRWNMQAFAAWGYVVVAPNFHGSTSFGQEFADSINGGWGDRPYRDCMASMDAVIAEGYVDPDRTAAMGGSYGGYMVSWIAGRTDRFAALVNHAGVANLLSEYASDVTYDWGRSLGGTPWDGLETIDRMNPMRFAAGFRSPMLVIHGEQDYRVPATQGLEIYNVYKARGLPARLLWFPDENHWILKPRNGRLWYREVENWLARWLR